MEITHNGRGEQRIKPSPIFALIKAVPFLLLSCFLLCFAWYISPSLTWFSLMAVGFGCYRYWYIRRTVLIRCLGSLAVQRGVFFKTTIIIDIHRLKGYAVKQSSMLRMLQLVDLALTTKDRDYPVIWIRGVPMADIDTSILEYIREKGEKKTCKRL